MVQATSALPDVERLFDATFRVTRLDKDPACSLFLPMVYDLIGVDWRNFFEPEFTECFNGTMIRESAMDVEVRCICFHTEEVLTHILNEAHPGDETFAHHPINMKCGDPRGA